MNRLRLLEMIWQDALYALRAMRQNPGFAATAVLTLALAIGGNTAMFTVIRAVLLKPLEYFVSAYRLTHLLLDRRYVELDELRLRDASVIAQSGDYLLVAFGASPA